MVLAYGPIGSLQTFRSVRKFLLGRRSSAVHLLSEDQSSKGIPFAVRGGARTLRRDIRSRGHNKGLAAQTHVRAGREQ